MKVRIAAAAVFALLLTGCINTPDSEGWHRSQKKEFFEILKDDRYMSLCNDGALYEKVKRNENSKLMSKLLIDYVDHLANGCIDMAAFKAAQNARKSDKFKTHYEIYRQKVDPAAIKMQLKAGRSIDSILKPYVPSYREWERLVSAYRSLSIQDEVDTALLKRVRLNIERVKLLKPETSPNYALVNIPEFRVRIIENGKTAVSMGVVVGKTHMQTPIFGEDLKYIVVNPQWNVPDSIARNEVIPRTLRDPSYLARHRLVIRRDYNLDSPALSFNALNPQKYVGGKGPVPFKFIEPPSKRNGLGRVKFLFPNRHSVYMHDTQSKYLFKRKVRAYSHGCVRLEKPNDLLKHIVTHYTNLTWEEAKAQYQSMKTHYIKLTKRLPVHTAYFTVYVDDDGMLRQFKDIYGYDRLQKLNF